MEKEIKSIFVPASEHSEEIYVYEEKVMKPAKTLLNSGSDTRNI